MAFSNLVGTGDDLKVCTLSLAIAGLWVVLNLAPAGGETKEEMEVVVDWWESEGHYMFCPPAIIDEEKLSLHIMEW